MERFPFPIALNASTIRNFNLDVAEQIETTAKAGYDGIELWYADIASWIESGHSLNKLKQHIQQAGVPVVNGISFFHWTGSDADVRKQGIEQAKKELSIWSELGCNAVAAPPLGDVATISLDEMAEHFAELGALAQSFGVTPYLEIWGMAAKLSTLAEAVHIAVQSGIPNAKLLIDVFHLQRGGSKLESLHLLNGDCIGMVHLNDYPSGIPAHALTDDQRLFPGEGVANIAGLLKGLEAIQYKGYVSLELFLGANGGRNAIETAQYGLSRILNLQTSI